MAEDTRRFDDLVRTVAELRRSFDDTRSTLLARLAAVGAVEPREARYYQSAPQSIPNATDQRVYLNAAEYTCDDVVGTSGTSSAGSYFTLARGGVWRASANVRFAAGGAATAERYVCITEGFVTTNVRYAAQGATPGAAGPVTLSCSSEFRVAAGAVVAVWVFQASGGALSLDTTWRSVNFSLTWVGP